MPGQLRQASSPEQEISVPHSADGDYDPLAGTPLLRAARFGGQAGHRRFWRTLEEVSYDPLR